MLRAGSVIDYRDSVQESRVAFRYSTWDELPRHWLVAAGAMLLLVHVVFLIGRTGPGIGPDEFGYLNYSRFFAGRPTSEFLLPFGDTPFYAPGVGLVTFPFFALFDSPVAQFRSVQAVNLGLLLLTFLAARWLLRTTLSISDRRATVAAGVALLYPSYVLFSGTSMSETLLLALVTATGASLGRYLSSARAMWAALTGLVAGMAPLAHGRGWVVVLAMAVAATAMAILLPAKRRSLIVLTGCLLVAIAITRLITDVAGSALYPHPISSGELAVATVRNPRAYGDMLLRAIGLAWYLLVGSGALTALGALFVMSRRREATIETWIVWLWLATALGGCIAVSAAVVTGLPRADHFMYGRYVEPFALLFLAAGIAALPELADRRLLARRWLLSSGALIAVLSVSLYLFVPKAVWSHQLVAINVTAVLGAIKLFGGVQVIWLGGAAIVGMAALIGMQVLGRYASVAGLVVFFLVAAIPGVQAHKRWAHGGNGYADRPAAMADLLQKMRIRKVAVCCAEPLSHLGTPWLASTTAFVARPGKRWSEQPGIGISPDEERPRDARVLLPDPAFPRVLWVSDPKIAAELDRRGWMLPAVFPGPMPAEAYRSAISGTVTPTGRATVAVSARVKHDGEASPWAQPSPTFGPRGAVQLSLRTVETAGVAKVGPEVRVSLGRHVLPGETVEITAEVPLPPLNGPALCGRRIDVAVRLQLVQAGVVWFAARGDRGVDLNGMALAKCSA